MSVRDAFNNNFLLPDMSDFYYDTPDQEYFMSNMDRALNPLTPHNPIMAYRFYHEEPPTDVGYDAEHMIYTFGVKLGSQGLGQSYNMQIVRNLIVDDGDTIQIPYDCLTCADNETQKYLQTVSDKYWADLISSGYTQIRDDEKPMIGLRMACIDTKELPHFVPIGRTENFKNTESITMTYNEATENQTGEYLVSRYSCFMEAPDKIDPPSAQDQKVTTGAENPINNTDTSPMYLNSTFYNYAREVKTDEKIKLMQVGNNKYAQYFDSNGYRFICVQAASNAYDSDKVADGGAARDIVANMINNAEEMRILINGSTISRNGNQPVSMFKSDNSGTFTNTALKFMETIFDDQTAFTSSGFNPQGQDLHGRFVSVVYVKVNGQWINLNKMVKVDTNYTLTNTYANNKLLSNEREADYIVNLFKPESYNVELVDYCDSLIQNTKLFDDREQVQAEILGELNKETNTYIKPMNWNALKNWTIIIGDVVLLVPPTSIHSITQSKAQRMPLIRAKGSMAKGATKNQKLINIDLYFYGDISINGFRYKTKTGIKKDGKDITYWMNGLRALIAQFKVAPFMPIENEFINDVMNIDAVSMLDFTVETVPNFPALLKASLQLAEFEYRIYMPEIPKYENVGSGVKYVNYFAKQINYPLFRYFYQRLIRNGEELKNVKFLDDKYIVNTFGNKTCLIPMNFGDSQVKFYIPNEAHLAQLKQIKLSRLQKPSTTPNLSPKNMDLAHDFSKIYDSIEGCNEAKAILSELNTKLNDAPNTFFISSQATWLNTQMDPGKLYIYKADAKGDGFHETKKGSEEAFTDGISTEELEEYVNSRINDALTAYQSSIGNLKNASNEILCTDSHIETNYVSENKKGAINSLLDIGSNYTAVGSALIIDVNVKYMNEEELTILKSYSTSRPNVAYSSDEVFKNRHIAIPIMISLPKSTKIRRLGRIGDTDEIFVTIRQGIDVDFISFAKEVYQANEVRGDSTANDKKQTLDWQSADTLKFEEFKLSSPLIAQSIAINFSNIFSQITLQQVTGYAPQYMGGSDINIQLIATTIDKNVAAAMDQLPQIAATYAREYGIVLATWPLKIESQITKFFGITDVLIDNVSVSTIPNFPGVYQISMVLTSMDRSLRNRESLKATSLNNADRATKNGAERRRYWEYETINKLLSKAELYPDLELPTIQELKEAGFTFVRYSNPEREYPDPDFYFTYTYILIPQLVREAVVHMFDVGELAGKLSLVDTTGKHMNGTIFQSLNSYEKDFELEKNWYKTIDDAFQNPDEQAKARIMSDFIYDSVKDRNQVWTVSPKIKISMMERRYMSHVSDAEHNEYAEKQLRKKIDDSSQTISDTKYETTSTASETASTSSSQQSEDKYETVS